MTDDSNASSRKVIFYSAELAISRCEWKFETRLRPPTLVARELIVGSRNCVEKKKPCTFCSFTLAKTQKVLWSSVENTVSTKGTKNQESCSILSYPDCCYGHCSATKVAIFIFIFCWTRFEKFLAFLRTSWGEDVPILWAVFESSDTSFDILVKCTSILKDECTCNSLGY